MKMRSKINDEKHIRFPNMLVLVVMLVSLCFQGIYWGSYQNKLSEFSSTIAENRLDRVHQNLLDNVADVITQTENLFTFARMNGLSNYANAYLNLRDEQYVSEQLAEMEKVCLEMDFKSDFMDGFLVLGKNSNQKSMYYDFASKKIVEFEGFCQEVLSESGLDLSIYQSLGVPMSLDLEEFMQSSAHQDVMHQEYAGMAQFMELCQKHYIVTDVFSGVMVIAFLDTSCFSTGLENQKDYAFALYTSNAEEIFRFGEIEHKRMIKESIVQPDGLEVVTELKRTDTYRQRYIGIGGFCCILFFNILSYIFIKFYLGILVEPWRFLKKVLLSLVLVCMIPFLLLHLILNHMTNQYSNQMLDKYLDTCILQYENACKRFQSDCESMSVSPAIQLIEEYDSTNTNKNMELISNFETSILPKIDLLPNYSYMLVTDNDGNLLYQSSYMGRTELFSKIIGRVSQDTKNESETFRFWVTEDTISNGHVIVFCAPVVKQNTNIGNIVFAMKEPILSNYIGLEQENVEYVLIDDTGEVYGNDKGIENIGESNLSSITTNSKEKKERYHDWMVGVCNQTVFENTSLLLCVDVENYVRIFDVSPMSSIVIALILAVVIALISWVMLLENEKRYEKEKKLIELRVEAEFKMLQQQINPHFMFNTLEIINLIASVNQIEEISSVTRALADILRFSLTRSQTVTVGEEITALNNYLLIQNMRFGDRVQLVTDFDEKLFEHTMLKFVLQPLVENSISHGVYHKLKDGEIKICLSKEKENLVFEISDNGVGMSQEQLNKLLNSLHGAEEYSYSTKGSGLGLKNIYRRISYYYDGDAKMLIESTEQVGTKVKLILPIVD